VPGVSVSAIALGYGINANVIRKWLPRRKPGTTAALATMLPVTIEPVVTRKASAELTLGAARPAIELSLAGATVRLPAGFDPAELRSIAQILAALR
jgi:transposase-like protein